jgi:type VI secretion system secreted protein VgrG
VPYSQTDRTLQIQTPLGADELMLVEVDGEERISEPYLFRIRFVTERELTPEDLLGKAVAIEFGFAESALGLERRKLHGIVRKLRRGAAERGGNAEEWYAEVVPRLWFLSRTSDCRIFQNKSIPDIVKEVLSMHGVTAVSDKLVGSYPTRDYVVQYRESALDFVQRLMEQEGIFYWHEHTDSQHTMVLADSNSATTPYPMGVVPFLGGDGGALSITRLDDESVVRSGKWTVRDFNFLTPSTLLQSTEPTTIGGITDMDRLERYDYPGIHEDNSAGTVVAKRRIEHEETFHLLRRGESQVSWFNAGMTFETDVRKERTFLLTEVHHHAEDFSYWTIEAWGKEPRDPSYNNSFVAIPKRVPYRPERVTPRPFVHGPQTAIVTGPAGEEIYTDEHGRVKVQFHWDRLGQNDENTSCWIRVSQGWAGKNWGQVHIPRIGHEVIVDFLEGDPDRPIVTGRVYHAENKYPYGLPTNKTQSGIKTRSSPGGGSDNFNELRFEDKKGAEEIFMHAERDLNTEVENNETHKVGLGDGIGNRTTDIKGDEKTDIKGNKTTDVAKNFKETIIGTETRKVTGAVDETFDSTEKRTVLGTFTEDVTGAYTVTVKPGAYSLTAIGGITMTSPVAVGITSATATITLTAGVEIKQVSPKWFKTGANSGDAYANKIGMAMNKLDMAGNAIGIVGNKCDIVNLKLDNFMMAIKTGGIEIKNKALVTRSKAFEADRGLKLYMA